MASFSLLTACVLTTDFDGLSRGDGPTDGAPPSSREDGGGADGETTPPDEDGGLDAGKTYAELVLEDQPLAYFPFDEPSGATLVTETISGKSAPLKKEVFTPGVAGVAGNALGATGDGNLEIGDVLDLIGKDPWTLEAWIKPEVVKSKVFYEYFNKRDDGNGLVAYVRYEDGKTTAQVEQSYGSGGRGVDGDLPSLDHFIHIVFVYDPGRTGLRLWIDGKVSEAGYDDKGGPTDNARPVAIATGIRGAIDELALYGHALPDARILAHFAAGKR